MNACFLIIIYLYTILHDPISRIILKKLHETSIYTVVSMCKKLAKENKNTCIKLNVRFYETLQTVFPTEFIGMIWHSTPFPWWPFLFFQTKPGQFASLTWQLSFKEIKKKQKNIIFTLSQIQSIALDESITSVKNMTVLFVGDGDNNILDAFAQLHTILFQH